VSSRTYLSIGDVLTLLREEFPDVTISKIRFLESQGLVNPERSPSGYRKFFEHDVERLRWVLRQQREHFLPLKVIRDRLADGELDDADPARPNGKPTKADEEAMARILADASRRAAHLPEGAHARRGLQVVGDGGEPPLVTADAHAERVTASSGPESAPLAVQSGKTAGGPAGARGAAQRTTPPSPGGAANGTPLPRRAETAGAPPAGGATGARRTPAPSDGRPPPGTPPPGTTSGMVTGASLTADELSAASGLSPDEVARLEGFGLIEPVMVAGIQTYDEDALTMANLAAAFGAFGIEPRHLRLYRNAVDREVGLIEQVVIPLLRQRNPESRQRALEGAEQLAALGQSMRATLLHQALRRHLGG
jgi:DNA-binding transcriptional MerR regulator